MHKIDKTWGSELVFANNELYCGKIITCEDGLWSSKGLFHYHQNKDETFYVIEGTLQLQLVEDDSITEYYLTSESDSVRVLPGVSHRFRSYTNSCKFVEVSTFHDDSDSYRISLDSLGIEHKK